MVVIQLRPSESQLPGIGQPDIVSSYWCFSSKHQILRHTLPVCSRTRTAKILLMLVLSGSPASYDYLHVLESIIKARESCRVGKEIRKVARQTVRKPAISKQSDEV